MSVELAALAAKPKIIVSDADHRRLSDLATGAARHFPEVSEALQNEMDRAEIRAAARMPGDVVQMGSTVTFRSAAVQAEAGEPRRVTLVYPPDADISVGRISILTPIGAALIGLAAGQSIRFPSYDGREQELTVIAVEAPA